ncbi:MAG: sodium:proton antiporter [Candidatus Thiodiazotropha sp.]
MGFWETLAGLLTLTAVFAYLNHRWLHLPSSIGVMSVALVFSLSLVLLQGLGFDLTTPVRELLDRISFDTTLLHGLLGFLLFAGALSVDLTELRREALPIAFLSTLGVLISTLAVGGGAYAMLGWIGQAEPFIDCLLFGALISPTDPIAVLALLKRLGAAQGLKARMAGESLFNDGVGVTLFLLLLAVHEQSGSIDPVSALLLFARETLGGILFGILAGGLIARLLRGVDQYTVEILLTLALVSGGFTLADHLDVSAPLAVVVSGLIIGHHGRNTMSQITRHHLDLFWHLLDEIFNSVLFVLIGLEVLMMHFQRLDVAVILVLIPVVLAARLLSVGLPYLLLHRRGQVSHVAFGVMVWGGLRGGLSVAMALSLPTSTPRDLLVAATYGVVVFGLLLQGGSLSWLLRRAPIRDHLDPAA